MVITKLDDPGPEVGGIATTELKVNVTDGVEELAVGVGGSMIVVVESGNDIISETDEDVIARLSRLEDFVAAVGAGRKAKSA